MENFSFSQILLSLFQPSQDAIPQKKIFPAANYHPIHGIKEKVDNPTLPFKTVIPSRAPWIGTHINGSSLDRHIINSQLYKDAFQARKSKSFFIENQVGQLSFESRNRPWQGRMGTFVGSNGNNRTISSRNPKVQFQSNFFSTARGYCSPEY